MQNVSFSLARGETLSIVGESGSGKSTLARMLSGLTPPDRGQITVNKKAPVKGRHIQIIFQHPFASFNPTHTLAKSLAEPYVISGQSVTPRKLTDTLAQVDLTPDLLERFPSQVSGGELQRAALVRALALNPRYLILDEACTMLDISNQARIIHLLKHIQTRLKLGMVFITHDLNLAAFMGGSLAVMQAGRFIEHGPAGTVLNKPATAYTRQLIHYFREFDDIEPQPFYPNGHP